MIKINEANLVEISVSGEIFAPEWPKALYQVDEEGRVFVLPGPGGIHYNLRVGDRAYGWAAWHPEPGASVRNPDGEANVALGVLACVGNRAIMTSGEAEGETGVVVGKGRNLAWAEGYPDKYHVILHFAKPVLDRLGIGDKVLIHARGYGLRVEGHPDVMVKNCSPELIAALGLEEDGDGRLAVPAVAKIPSVMMGMGAGLDPETGAHDIAVHDSRRRTELGIADLRIGDVVALEDQDHRYGRVYRKGAVTVGTVSYGDSPSPGCGPGVTTLLTCPAEGLRVRLEESANLIRYLRLEG